MRLAVLSDIHGNLPALEAVMGELKNEAVDFVVNLGDIVSGPLWPSETADRLMMLAWPTIAGNHERQVLATWTHDGAQTQAMSRSDAYAASQLLPLQCDWLAALPGTLRLADDVLCCHGTPDSNIEYWMETVAGDFPHDGSTGARPASLDEARQRLGRVSATLVMCGHTHTPRAMQIGETLVVNPGSVGLQAYNASRPQPHVMENGSPHARWAVLQRSGGGWSVQHRATAYDWEASARQAEANGRPDWAHALRTGRAARISAE